MSNQPRDWDKELAAIDKVIARAPAEGGAAPPPASRPVAAVTVSRKAVFTTWLRVGLAIVLAAAMTQWPYPNGCGLNLFIYLGAVAGVVVAGLWSTITSWYRRLGLAHTLSVLVTLWGLVLAAREILPRVGYAKVALRWLCP